MRHDRNLQIIADELRLLVEYDPLTGLFYSKVGYPGVTAGKLLGGKPNKAGYIATTVLGVRYYAHRLAWLYMTGKWPLELIDHINGIRSDNRFVNLREATETQNRINSVQRASVSGYRGVVFHPETKKWRAVIKVGKNPISLGLFTKPENAALAYNFAAAEHFGDFARFNKC